MSLSLARRLSLSSTIVLIFFFGITGAVLEYNYKNTLKQAVQERLRLHTYAILAVAEPANRHLIIPKKLQEDAFNQPDSVLLAFVVDNQKELWRSLSANNKDIYYGTPTPQGAWYFGRYHTEDDKDYFVSKYGISWDVAAIDGRSNVNYNVIVMENMDYFNQSLIAYRWQITFALSFVALLLLIVQGINLHWSLLPLRKLVKDLKEIDQGASDQLKGQYPNELTMLVTNLNLLIDHERRQRERYRNSLADLSHSLKTPLAVMRGLERDFYVLQERSEHPSPKNPQQSLTAREILTAVNKQVDRMDNIISYQLQRAATLGSAVAISATPVAEVAKLVLDALLKVYATKAVEVTTLCDANAIFYGDKDDLFELLGNLCDNAFKMCVKRVRVTAKMHAVEKSSRPGLILLVEDDGRGVAASEREAILKRGVRLDSVAQGQISPGQGIGLAVVVDIINSCQGTIAINDSELGGAAFCLMFPAR